MRVFILLISAGSIAAAAARTTSIVADVRFLDTAVSYPPPPPTQGQFSFQPPVTSAALLVRGGGGGGGKGLMALLPEPLTAAKWYSRIGLVQGVLMISSPSAINELYGVTSTRQHDWLVDCSGHGLISSFVFMHCLLDRNNLDVNRAMAYCLIVWLLFTIRQVLNDKEALSVGYKKEGFVAGMLLHAITIYTVFANGHDNALANILVKVEAIFWTISGLLFFIFPRLSAKLWGQKSDLEDDDTATVRLMQLSGAIWLCHFGAATWLLFQNDNITTSSLTARAVQAFGYGALVYVAHFVNTLVTSNKIGLGTLLRYAWAMLHAVFSYLMLSTTTTTTNSPVTM